MSDGRRDDTERLLAGVDAPRPLPPELRDRLENQLLSAGGDTAPIALGADLEERLEATLTDPVAGQLRGIDGPRALSPELRDRLERQLTPRAAPRRMPSAFVGAAAAVVLLAALVVAVARPSGGSHEGGSSASSSAQSPERADGVGAGNSGQSVGSTGGVASTGGGVSGVMSSPGPTKPALSSQDQTTYAGGAGADKSAAAGISGTAPDAGPLAGGTKVTVRGRGFGDAVAVTFGGRPASYHAGSDTTLTAVTPPMPAPHVVDVVVRLRDGTTLTAPNAFNYLAPPRVDAVSPSTGTTNGGTWVTVTGAALRRTTGVVFGDALATQFRVVSETEVRALAPQHLPGPVDVRVTTPGGRSATSGGDRYTYLP